MGRKKEGERNRTEREFASTAVGGKTPLIIRDVGLIA